MNKIAEPDRSKYPAHRRGMPDTSVLRNTRHTAPALHSAMAMPIVRDRFERLVTAIHVQVPIDTVWKALVDPAALGKWLAVCHSSLEDTERDCTLDFEDGEFFFCRPLVVEAPRRLEYIWRWLGIGQGTHVTWELDKLRNTTKVTVTEEAINPPFDWQTWNGGGWPGILEQLDAYLRTGTEWRWPWRRMGPYAQIELPVPFYMAWEALFSPAGLRFWMQVMHGSFGVDSAVDLVLGDASGMARLTVTDLALPGERPTSFLPFADFKLTRGCWNTELTGRVWMEPAGLGRSLLQVFHHNWESLPPQIQLSERKIVAAFWAGALRRAAQMLSGPGGPPPGPHSW